MKNPIPFSFKAPLIPPAYAPQIYDDLREAELRTLIEASMRKKDFLHVPSGEIVTSRYYSRDPLVVIEGAPFQATLHFEGFAHKANWLFKDEERNILLTMFPTEFMSLLRRVSLVDPGYVSGTWGYKSRGGVFGIELITAD